MCSSDLAKRPIEEMSGDFYPGCHARVSYSVYAWQHPVGGAGVSCGLNNVQKVKDDTAFDGRSDASDDFDELDIEMVEEDFLA